MIIEKNTPISGIQASWPNHEDLTSSLTNQIHLSGWTKLHYTLLFWKKHSDMQSISMLQVYNYFVKNGRKKQRLDIFHFNIITKN